MKFVKAASIETFCRYIMKKNRALVGKAFIGNSMELEEKTKAVQDSGDSLLLLEELQEGSVISFPFSFLHFSPRC